MNKITKVLSILALAVVLPLTGCVAAAPTTDTTASHAAKPAETPKEQNGTLAFGEAKTYSNGVSLSVSESTVFVPSDSAYGVVTGMNYLAFTVVLTNNSDEALEPSPYTTLSAGGVESDSVYDTENSIGRIGGSPETVILPGQTVQWIEGFNVADVTSLTLQSAPSYEYTDAVFTNIK